MVTIWLLGVGLSYAASYVYDGNGRLIAVTRDDGTSARYVYDALGNLQQVVTVSPGQLTILGFAPNHGSPGQAVTISGQGFSSTPASDAVTFDGAPATVTSATATTLNVIVPSAAVTGSISVTVGSQTTTSTEPFVVDGTGLPPTITSFSPTIVDAGTTVTLVGQHLDPVTGETAVTVDGQAASPATVSDAQITFPAPASAGSGHVSVETPYGLALSSADLVVAPKDVGAVNIAAAQRISVGETQTLNIPSDTQYDVLLFDASNDSWLSFQLDALTGTASEVFYTVYGPQNRIVTSGVLSASSPSLHLPPLSATGTYSIYFQPYSGSATFNVGLEAAPVVDLNGPVMTSKTTIVNQSKRFVFSAVQGQALAIPLPAVATTPAGDDVDVILLTPSNAELISSWVSTPTTVNVPNLPQNGTYQLVLAPYRGDTRDVSFQVINAETGQLTIDGASPSFTTAQPGQNAYLGFQATAGDNLELALSGVTSTSSYGFVDVAIYDAYGNNVGSQTCYASSPNGGCGLHLWHLTGGAYSIAVQPADASSTIGFTATLTRDLVGTLAIDQTATVSLSRPGQNELLSFNATAGQTIAVHVASVTTTPAENSVDVTVYAPDGTSLSEDTATDSTTLNVPNLPGSGTYVVDIDPQYGLPATANVTLAAGVTGTLAIDGNSSSYTTATPGENVFLTFTAAAGDNLGLGLSGMSSSTGNGVGYDVFDANGNQVASQWCSDSSSSDSCNVNMPNLAGGAYTVIVTPDSVNSTVGFTATLTRDLVGTLTTNKPLTVLLQRPGQVESLSFSGSANQNVTIASSGTQTTPTGSCIAFKVSNPDGSYLRSWDSCDTDDVKTLPPLPTTGTYVLTLEPYDGAPTQTTISLTESAAAAESMKGPWSALAFQSMPASVAQPTASLRPRRDALAGQALLSP